MKEDISERLENDLGAYISEKSGKILEIIG
jgi:hypothetical protein